MSILVPYSGSRQLLLPPLARETPTNWTPGAPPRSIDVVCEFKINRSTIGVHPSWRVAGAGRAARAASLAATGPGAGSSVGADASPNAGANSLAAAPAAPGQDTAIHLTSLINYLHEELVGTAHKMLASSRLQKSDRDDLIQEAWVKLVKRYSKESYTEDKIGKLVNLWKSVVRTTLIDNVRKRSRRREYTTPVVDVPDPGGAAEKEKSERVAIRMASVVTAKSKLSQPKQRFVTIWLSLTEQSCPDNSQRDKKRRSNRAPGSSKPSVMNRAVGQYNSTLQCGEKRISLQTGFRWVRDFRNLL